MASIAGSSVARNPSGQAMELYYIGSASTSTLKTGNKQSFTLRRDNALREKSKSAKLPKKEFANKKQNFGRFWTWCRSTSAYLRLMEADSTPITQRSNISASLWSSFASQERCPMNSFTRKIENTSLRKETNDFLRGSPMNSKLDC